MTTPLYMIGINQVKAYRAIQERVYKIIKQHDLDAASEWFIICHIYNFGPTQSKDLAKILGVEPPLIVSLTDSLAQKKFIKKSRNKIDQRVKTINITRKGKQLVPLVEKALSKELKKLLKGIESSDLKTYAKVLDSIIKNNA
jgi:DNA-binding MarR family transcriptional regulator